MELPTNQIPQINVSSMEELKNVLENHINKKFSDLEILFNKSILSINEKELIKEITKQLKTEIKDYLCSDCIKQGIYDTDKNKLELFIKTQIKDLSDKLSSYNKDLVRIIEEHKIELEKSTKSLNNKIGGANFSETSEELKEYNILSETSEENYKESYLKNKLNNVINYITNGKTLLKNTQMKNYIIFIEDLEKEIKKIETELEELKSTSNPNITPDENMIKSKKSTLDETRNKLKKVQKQKLALDEAEAKAEADTELAIANANREARLAEAQLKAAVLKEELSNISGNKKSNKPKKSNNFNSESGEQSDENENQQNSEDNKHARRLRESEEKSRRNAEIRKQKEEKLQLAIIDAEVKKAKAAAAEAEALGRANVRRTEAEVKTAREEERTKREATINQREVIEMDAKAAVAAKKLERNNTKNELHEKKINLEEQKRKQIKLAEEWNKTQEDNKAAKKAEKKAAKKAKEDEKAAAKAAKAAEQKTIFNILDNIRTEAYNVSKKIFNF
jgi:colicin import membrane protein